MRPGRIQLMPVPRKSAGGSRLAPPHTEPHRPRTTARRQHPYGYPPQNGQGPDRNIVNNERHMPTREVNSDRISSDPSAARRRTRSTVETSELVRMQWDQTATPAAPRNLGGLLVPQHTTTPSSPPRQPASPTAPPAPPAHPVPPAQARQDVIREIQTIITGGVDPADLTSSQRDRARRILDDATRAIQDRPDDPDPPTPAIDPFSHISPYHQWQATEHTPDNTDGDSFETDSDESYTDFFAEVAETHQ